MWLLCFLPMAHAGQFYLAGLGGLDLIPQITPKALTINNIFAGTPTDATVEFHAKQKVNPAYQLAFAIGYKRGWFRGEAEGAYNHAHMTHHFTDFSITPNSATFPGGVNAGYAINSHESKISVIKVLFNVFYDFDSLSALKSTPIKPYMGMGFGMAQVHYKYNINGTLTVNTPGGVTTPTAVILGNTTATSTRALSKDSHDCVFAYQILAGTQVKLNKNVSFSLDYRFLKTARIDPPINESVISHGAKLGLLIYL